MSDTNAVTTDASLDELHGVGAVRSEQLPADTVGELANSAAQSIANQTDELSGGEIETIIETAREALDEYDGPVEATVYTKDDDGDSDDDESDAEVVEESFGDDVDSFIEASPETVDGLAPEDCETIAILAGDDVFDVGGKHGGMSPEDMAKLVQHRLFEFDFDNVEEVIATGSGMGRTAVEAWASYTKNETDQELPALGQISVQKDGGYPTGDDYRDRNQRILEEVDGICVIANGDYVGMWVNMVRERPDDDVIIRTPELDDE